MHLQISTILPLLFFYLVATTHAKDDHHFECVDIFKQPSLQHPLLKHHKLEVKPTRRSTICPRGMVPIHKLHNNVNNFIDQQDVVNWVTLDTKVERRVYHGASAVLSIHNPKTNGKVSRAQIWIQRGDSQQLNAIIFGWAVHPKLYGDNLTHFTTYWTNDGLQKSGCYNTICKGFIQGSSDLYPGKPYEHVTTYGGEQVVADLSVVRDGSTGNWKLMNSGVLVGYWPRELFTHLELGADSIRYGGIATGGAPMGNGNFPVEGTDLSKLSYFKDMKYVDVNFNRRPINELAINLNAPKPNCYKLGYLKNQQTIAYGGPGGSCL